jgi:sugar phosphate isomerase/epimerase
VLKLSFSTGTLYHLPLRAAFALAHEAGFEGVELVLGPEALLRGAKYVRQLSQQYSLPVLSIHPPILPYPGQSKVVRILPRLISLAQGVGCDLVVLHTPKTSAPDSLAWTEFVDVMSRRDSASGVRVSLENAGMFRPAELNYLLHDLPRLRSFADRHDLPLTFDTAHAGTSAYELLEAYALFDGRVVNVHFSDLVQRRIFPDWPPLYTFFLHHQLPGQGILPLAEFVRTLLATGYSGLFTLELSPTAIQAWSIPRVREGLRSAVAFVRRIEAEA